MLDISKKASPEEISEAYRKMALKCHPDKKPDDEKAKANEKFIKLKEVYKILSDPIKKISMIRIIIMNSQNCKISLETMYLGKFVNIVGKKTTMIC